MGIKIVIKTKFKITRIIEFLYIQKIKENTHPRIFIYIKNMIIPKTLI
jgi:hypothetical protein